MLIRNPPSLPKDSQTPLYCQTPPVTDVEFPATKKSTKQIQTTIQSTRKNGAPIANRVSLENHLTDTLQFAKQKAQTIIAEFVARTGNTELDEDLKYKVRRQIGDLLAASASPCNSSSSPIMESRSKPSKSSTKPRRPPQTQPHIQVIKTPHEKQENEESLAAALSGEIPAEPRRNPTSQKTVGDEPLLLDLPLPQKSFAKFNDPGIAGHPPAAKMMNFQSLKIPFQ